MRKITVASLIFMLAFALTGCVQDGVPKSCSGLSEDKASSCIYVEAVSAQNAFHCYGLSKLDQREKCIKDASDPTMKGKVSSLSMDQKEAIFSTRPSSSIQSPLPSQQPSSGGGSPDYGANGSLSDQNGVLPSAPYLDQQTYTQAVQANDVQLCEEISDFDIMRSCISQVARQKKMPLICDTLANSENVDLCRMYSQGGDVKG